MESLVLRNDMTVESEGLHHLREDILLWAEENLHSHWLLRVISQQSDAEQPMPEPKDRTKHDPQTTYMTIKKHSRDGKFCYKFVRSWTEIVFDDEEERLLFKMRWL